LMADCWTYFIWRQEWWFHGDGLAKKQKKRQKRGSQQHNTPAWQFNNSGNEKKLQSQIAKKGHVICR
jgi:hypothetical protein